MDLAPLGVCFIRKGVIKNAKKVDIDEIIFNLKFRYSTDIRDQITFIQGIPRDVLSFEEVSGKPENFFKINARRQKYELEKYVFIWWMDINCIKSIQTRLNYKKEEFASSICRLNI